MMTCSMKSCLSFYGLNMNETVLGSKSRGVCGFCPSFGSSQSRNSKSRALPVLSVDFMGKPLLFADQTQTGDWSPKSHSNFSVRAQASFCVSRARRWWEKTLKPNMVEIHSAQELVDSLIYAGDRLVIVDFYSPGCGGCKTLHPKIKKFKDALAKYGTERSSLGPAKGLDESELMSLASIHEISIHSPFPSSREESVEDLVMESIDFSGVLSKAGNKMELKEEMLC
ncbi:thioredoxin-like 1-2, chloroplastic isoform X2 [Alnus glutinosa]|uniref:thioredoxin-like 1-2, chloroplastic isoform X2 n=1 Tax=Alnus glutinosa TaxID=3517 RepID=UPI002D784CD6|nr:thioredoxin-like 1-2, chloroplastic isoform X2 [Alnus glutinosa]